MQANELLEYRNKIIDAFKMVFFCLNIKKTDNAGYNYVLKDVKDFIQEIESMSEKIDLSLKNHHHQLIRQKSLLILVQMKTKKL